MILREIVVLEAEIENLVDDHVEREGSFAGSELVVVIVIELELVR